jgi:hypothetical protein
VHVVFVRPSRSQTAVDIGQVTNPQDSQPHFTIDGTDLVGAREKLRNRELGRMRDVGETIHRVVDVGQSSEWSVSHLSDGATPIGELPLNKCEATELAYGVERESNQSVKFTVSLLAFKVEFAQRNRLSDDRLAERYRGAKEPDNEKQQHNWQADE